MEIYEANPNTTSERTNGKGERKKSSLCMCVFGEGKKSWVA